MMHINVELRDERGMALWILGVMFNNDKDELNLENSPVKHVEKVVQIFFFFYTSILTRTISYLKVFVGCYCYGFLFCFVVFFCFCRGVALKSFS